MAREKAKAPKCIICNSERDGIPIRADLFVRSLRWLNGHTVRYNNPTRPVICRECFPKYLSLRKRYEGRLVAYLVLGFLFTGFLVYASHAAPLSFAFGLLIIAMMYLLSLVNYVPPLAVPKEYAAQFSAKLKSAPKTKR